jgi:2-C-methyl-D-erythritol 2,4-cyclodiphosphate synthase
VVRVGIGYDLHPLKSGRELILGGVRIQHATGLDGHSDADVLTHAVIDALLGAAGLGDIGGMFPASDARYRGASSLDLLSTAVAAVTRAGFRIVNVDSVVIAEAPRLSPHLEGMRRNLAATMQLGVDLVNVKATSPESVGSLGRKEGMAAQAIASLEAL